MHVRNSQPDPFWLAPRGLWPLPPQAAWLTLYVVAPLRQPSTAKRSSVNEQAKAQESLSRLPRHVTVPYQSIQIQHAVIVQRVYIRDLELLETKEFILSVRVDRDVRAHLPRGEKKKN